MKLRKQKPISLGRAYPVAPHFEDDPAVRLFMTEPYKRRGPRFQDRALREALLALPITVFEGANRYDTDDEHVLHLWGGGESWDIRLPKAAASELSESPSESP